MVKYIIYQVQLAINFRLDYNSAVSDEVLEEITDKLPHLHLLSLAYAGSDATISEEIVMKIGKLKELQTVCLKFRYKNWISNE